jgi:hypothetical protein
VEVLEMDLAAVDTDRDRVEPAEAGVRVVDVDGVAQAVE